MILHVKDVGFLCIIRFMIICLVILICERIPCCTVDAGLEIFEHTCSFVLNLLASYVCTESFNVMKTEIPSVALQPMPSNSAI